MKILGYLLLAYFVLQLLGKKTPASAGSTVVSGSGEKLTATDATIGSSQVLLDESGDLVTINSTGGITALPDPNGIGGGFAT